MTNIAKLINGITLNAELIHQFETNIPRKTDDMRDLQLPGRSPVHAPRAMASTSHPLATSAALDILRRGGNVVDAAIAAVAVHCVVEPAMTSVGGDCFCLYASKDSTTPIALNGSGRAPLGLI